MENRLERVIDEYPQLKLLNDQMWRLNHLYYIKDPQGNHVKFKLNWAQKEIFETMHTCEIVLKARQIGMTTFFSILSLDKVLWEDNIQCGVIAHTLDDATNIFNDKLKYAFDHLHPGIRQIFKPIGDSAKELSFAHGSFVRVGTSLRSSTLQCLHISEFGKICAKHPEKAREIMSGSLNTVHAGQSIWIESTAEGKEGYFYDMCQEAQSKTNLGLLDFKFRFFPWYKHPEYVLNQSVNVNEMNLEYFDKLSLQGINLSDPQKWWYAKKYSILKEDMLREYPSTPDEAFASSQEGYWYASQMRDLYDAGHITNLSYDRALPVHTASDLGQRDPMATWFFQINRSGEIYVIDYFEKDRCSVEQYAQILAQKGYVYGKHFWPHDAHANDRAGMVTYAQQARAFNILGIVLDQQRSVLAGINLARSTLSKCWFDATKCKQGLISLENYGKKWGSNIGGWTSEPNHNQFSHGADAFRYLCIGLPKILSSSSAEDDYKAVRAYWGAN